MSTTTTTITATVERHDADAGWEFYRNATGATRHEAAREATKYLPLGYGGHGRSERALESIRAGHVVQTPLGTYRLTLQSDLADEVRAYALDHYNEAFIWSAIVEATTDAELIDELTAAKVETLAEAIEHYTGVGEVLADREADARHTVEDFEPETEIRNVWERSELIEGRDGWGIRRETFGLSSRFWVELGRGLHGPFDTIDEAQDELAAEEGRGPRPATTAGDVELVSGFTAFAGHVVKVGDGVVVTFYPDHHGPNGPETREPTFGWVLAVLDNVHDRQTGEDLGGFVRVADIDGTERTFPVGDVKTVAIIGRRKS